MCLLCCSLEKGIKTRCLVNPVLEIAYNTEDFSSSQREGCWFPEEVRRVTYSSPTTNNTRGLKDTTLGPPVIRLNWGFLNK